MAVTLVLTIDGDDVEMFVKAGYRICIARNVKGSHPTYEVVWLALEVGIVTN
jgi:hypothetical protein